MEPVINAWPSVVQTVFLALIPLVAIWLNAYLKRIEEKVGTVGEKMQVVVEKVDENTSETKTVSTMVNSASQIQMELMVTTLEELLLVKPDDISVVARLEAAKKMLADHKIKQAVVDDRSVRA